MFSLSRRLGVSVDTLTQANGITDPSRLAIGQTLVVPPSSGRSLDPPSPDAVTIMAASDSIALATPLPLRAAALIGGPSPVPTPGGPASLPSAIPTPSPSVFLNSPAFGNPFLSGPPPRSLATSTPGPLRSASPTPAASVSPRPTELARWVGSPNFWEGRPAGPPIAIVLHTAAGTLAGMGAWFANPESESSAHYGIGRNGEIHQYVKLEDRSWTNGALEPNNSWPGPQGPQPNELTVNIETEDLNQVGLPVTDAEYDATLRVGRAILDRYPNIKYLVTHRSLDPQSRANDPGPRWLDSGRFAMLARDLKLTPIP
jgi:hypothetical protein